MVTIVCLGTGAAIPGPGRDNTSLAIDDGTEVTLVDVSGAPVKRLREHGLNPTRLARVIITHEHLDHTYGYPSLLQSLWLSGRRQPLEIYAQAATWAFLDRLTDAFRPGSWTTGFPVARHVVEPGGLLVNTGRIAVQTAPTRHSAPTIGLRVESAGGGVAVYSSDTSPTESVIRLARGADVLIHEATFLAGAEGEANRLGHSTAAQAARAALDAEVKRLVLIHFTPGEDGELARLRSDAMAIYPGPVDAPSDGARFDIA